MSIVSFEYMQFHHLLLFLGWYIHDLVDIITTVESFSPMTYVSTHIFQLKLFGIAVTLKYGQGQWNWYKQAKLN